MAVGGVISLFVPPTGILYYFIGGGIFLSLLIAIKQKHK